jgi:hypothetical protein
MDQIFIDGDFPSGEKCKFHCWPSCHPMQVGPEDVFGCTHKAWPANQYGDFCPIVKCGGEIAKCEVTDEMLASLERQKYDALSKLKRRSLIEERTKELEVIQEFRQLLSKERA